MLLFIKIIFPKTKIDVSNNMRIHFNNLISFDGNELKYRRLMGTLAL